MALAMEPPVALDAATPLREGDSSPKQRLLKAKQLRFMDVYPSVFHRRSGASDAIWIDGCAESTEHALPIWLRLQK
jgi:hypothetical protein